MKNSMFYLLAMLLLNVIIAGCSNDNEDYMYDLSESELQINDRQYATVIFPFAINNTRPEVKVALSRKKDLPATIISKINAWENDDPAKSTAVFCCEWEGKKVYYIYNMLQSSFLSTIYTAEGVLTTVWGDGIGSAEDFLKNATGWQLVYCTDVYKYIIL